jgi:hypothetical protein
MVRLCRVRILGIETPGNLLDQWAEWLAPERQPFFLADDELPQLEHGPRLREAEGELDPVIRDTYAVWRLDRDLRITWLTEQEFHALDRETRAKLVRAQHDHKRGEVPSVRAWHHVVPEARKQADGHRFVWWPSLLAGRHEAILVPWISNDKATSRHDEVPAEIWRAAAAVLPNARDLAGTWATASGPNCFGSVMAAAGVEGADSEWVVGEPFEDFLATRTKPGGHDDEPGTVLVWRDHAGTVTHAAVTLGGGYVFQKPSQCWYTPRQVLTVAETVKTSRVTGERLGRRRRIVA